MTLEESLFQQPTALYRGTPFWAWNGHLDREQLFRQIDQFKRMGFGGFHMHARTGLESPYLGDAFLKAIRDCTLEARRHSMLAWLYDEDRWPSGFAGGMVTEDPQHRVKYLLFTRTPYNGTTRPTPNWSCALAGRLETGTLLARYAVQLDAAGNVSYHRLQKAQSAPDGWDEWFAYLETADGVPWYNHQGYVDTLSSAAVERFVEVTHERYKACVGEFFGNTVPAIFTDEPQHLFKQCFTHATQGADLTLPATSDFFETFQKRYGSDLLDTLPELYWELPGEQSSLTRYRYHDHVTERFATAYAATLGAWCQRNGLDLTGHMMEEPTLFSQTHATGEAMRSLAHFQLPGIDMLCDEAEYTTAKQAQSIAHQYGRRGTMSELYGVTGWHFDFAGHKAQGDWQATLGVVVRVPHLAWLSMAGEAKRDFPASIHYQSPWWEEYRLIEDHFARVNVALTSGKPVVRIGVIHPIESFWLCYGPEAETQNERECQEQQFSELPRWLLRNLLDFDYISEALLPEQSTEAPDSGTFPVGAMHYDCVVVPSMRTIRGTTLDRLEAFIASGGRVVFAGSVPALVDAEPSSRAIRMAERARRCAWTERALVECLSQARLLDCLDPAGNRYRELLYQLRQDGKNRHLFICHRNRKHESGELTLNIKGLWKVIARDTRSGKCRLLHTVQNDSSTSVPIRFEAHGHWLLSLESGTSTVPAEKASIWHTAGTLKGPVPVTLEEPNALLLDQAEWRWNEGDWQPREEILRFHNRIREQCGLAPREGHVAQPWTDHDPVESLGRIDLRFAIACEIPVDCPELVLEDPDQWKLTLDGAAFDTTDAGWWVDEAIRRVKLPALTKGNHELVISRVFTRKTNLEWCYLLGDFGVKLRGRDASLIAPVSVLQLGDWTTQGLPFYSGNLTYHFELNENQLQAARAVSFRGFKAPLISVAINNQEPEPVAFAPFRFMLPPAETRPSRMDVKVFGNRHNAFGAVHNTEKDLRWIGPDAWRSTGERWSYAYHLKPMGLLDAPRLERDWIEPRS